MATVQFELELPEEEAGFLERYCRETGCSESEAVAALLAKWLSDGAEEAPEMQAAPGEKEAGSNG